MTNTAMHSARFSFLVFVILFLFCAPLLVSGLPSNYSGHVRDHALANTQNYTENLGLYLTSGETLWESDFNGGNITLGGLSVPSSVSTFSITLTHYNTWKPQFELFTAYGFGLLGTNEPNPNGVFLQISTNSQADAQNLASTLSQKFALAFEPLSQGNGVYSFFSPADFNTEMHVYFWTLVPSYYGGFASLMTEQQFESNDLSYYRLSYSTGSPSYSISIGALTPLTSSQFSLYKQLGLSGTGYNYSRTATQSSISVHVLGGIISNSTFAYTNDFSNFSALMTTNSKIGNGTIPDLNASLDLSFPTLIAYRQVSPTLAPSQNSNVSVTIFVKDVSPVTAPTAQNVAINDSWIYQYKNDFNLTIRTTGGKQNLTSGQTMTVAYAFKVLTNGGTYNLPAIPVTYQFLAGNKTVNGQALLNPETLVVGGQNVPLLEASETLSSGTIQAGQTFSVNVTIANKGSGTAFNLAAAGLKRQDLPQGSTWTFVSNVSSTSLTQTNSNVSYSVSWSDSSGTVHTGNTNVMSTIFSFASPGTPSVLIRKFYNLGNSSQNANITLAVSDTSPNAVTNLTISDPLPSGVTFAKSFNTSSLRLSGNNIVTGNITALHAHANVTLSYSVSFTTPHDNYVFMPAAASANWNNITITHQSAGFGLPLGVKASKSLSPTAGFQGSNVTVSIGLVNGGTAPIYLVSLNNTQDPFINITSSKSAYKAVLAGGGIMNATLKGTLMGTPGSYNATSSAATFMFAGANQTAVSSPYKVTVYQVIVANFTSSALKFEEDHNIQITITVQNPSNVTVNNVAFTLKLPPGLNIQYNGQPNFTVSSLGPNQQKSNTITVLTNQPNDYQINSTNANLQFQYQGLTLKGTVGTLNLNLQDDKTLRYVIPILVAAALVLAALFYVRRLQKRK